jgi:DNA-binding transcriptional ArsR family regulator
MENQFKQIATLIGDPTRAVVMWTLLDGKAFTASELAVAADTTPQNMSMHLSKLLQADLLCVESQGRHRYYKFARPDVAYAIEAMANLIPGIDNKKQPLPGDNTAIRHCRTCYDHLAGKTGVAITDSLLKQKIIHESNNNFSLGPKGERWFNSIGIRTQNLQTGRRPLLRRCLDWSERRHHMAGTLGALLLNKMLEDDWLRRTRNSRVIVITAKGEKMIQKHFGIAG